MPLENITLQMNTMSTYYLCLIHLVLVIFSFGFAYAWDADELELFDLVEEVNQNFYELLELSQDATGPEIRKAYRQLSLKYHPDKNKNDNAEEMFRKIVAVAEVLRDDEKRKRYDLILQNGLPDWRQPVYYYRRVRKMGLWEMAAFLFALITVGQYLVAWSVYWEKKYELEEVFMSRIRKKEKKAAKKGKNANAKNGVDTFLTEHLNQLPKPRCQNLLVVRLAIFLVYLIWSAPSFYQQSWEFGLFRRKQLPSTPDESEDEKEDRVRKPRRRLKPEYPDYSCIFPAVEAPSSESEDTQMKDEKTDQQNTTKDGLPWTEADITALQKAMTKFPVGTSQRWEKIAETLDRSVNEVTKKVKQMKTAIGGHVPASLQGITGSVDEFKPELPAVETKREEMNDKASIKTNISSRVASKKTAERTLMIVQQQQQPQCVSKAAGDSCKVPENSSEKAVDDTWSQQQQRALELALQQFPKGTDERWERIAKCVPGKTKEECILRFKTLAEIIKKKKMAQLS